MENLTIEETMYTPKIDLNSKGTITLVGKSFPENTFDFYGPMMRWVKNYFETAAAETTTINLEITYFNSTSSRLFFDFFDLLEEYHEEHNININWIYDEENENAEEVGEDFIADFESLKIKLITK